MSMPESFIIFVGMSCSDQPLSDDFGKCKPVKHPYRISVDTYFLATCICSPKRAVESMLASMIYHKFSYHSEVMRLSLISLN